VKTVQRGLEPFVTPTRTKAQVALRYALSHPAVATIIPGASRVEQLEENATATEPLGPKEVEQLRQLTKANKYDAHR
jgi:1-deoxyxylulose-5-phosphate synthase